MSPLAIVSGRAPRRAGQDEPRPAGTHEPYFMTVEAACSSVWVPTF